MTASVSYTEQTTDDRLAKRNALLLAAAQAAGGSMMTITIATGGLVGQYLLGPETKLATLPVTSAVIGIACGTIPAAMLMQRLGRRPGFMIGAALGISGGLLGWYAIMEGLFLLFCLSTTLGGLSAAFVQQYRFAAADTASAQFRPKAISWVLAGGVLAGVVGPQTIILTKDLFTPILFAGAYLGMAALSAIAMMILVFIRIPKPVQRQRLHTDRPIWAALGDARVAVAIICGIIAYSLMSLVMTAAPLAMVACGLSADDATLGIQWHVIAMFGPSFFTGSLIARYGSGTITAIGLLLLAISGAVFLAGLAVGNFWIGLILLGLGWNFGFIGATSMLTAAQRPEEAARLQAANDFCIFGAVALASFFSGKMLNTVGWEVINWTIFPMVTFALAALAWLIWRERARRA